jgi:hypothetical protein
MRINIIASDHHFPKFLNCLLLGEANAEVSQPLEASVVVGMLANKFISHALSPSLS